MTEPLRRQTLTVEEVAAVLGISRGRAYESARKGELPGILHIGRRILISRLALQRWLEAADPVADSTDDPE